MLILLKRCETSQERYLDTVANAELTHELGAVLPDVVAAGWLGR
jgi:hypothetical protein